MKHLYIVPTSVGTMYKMLFKFSMSYRHSALKASTL